MDYLMFRPFWQYNGLSTRFFDKASKSFSDVRKIFKSSSLIMAKRQERSRARMSTYIRKKTSESLPFGSLSTEDILSLRTNNSIPCAKPSVMVVSISTQTDELLEETPQLCVLSTAETQTEHSGPVWDTSLDKMMAELREYEKRVQELNQYCEHYKFNFEYYHREHASLNSKLITCESENNRLKTELHEAKNNSEEKMRACVVQSLQSLQSNSDPRTSNQQHFYNRGRHRRGRYN